MDLRTIRRLRLWCDNVAMDLRGLKQDKHHNSNELQCFAQGFTFYFTCNKREGRVSARNKVLATLLLCSYPIASHTARAERLLFSLVRLQSEPRLLAMLRFVRGRDYLLSALYAVRKISHSFRHCPRSRAEVLEQ